MLKRVNSISATPIILVENFNIYPDTLLDSQGENPIRKKIYCQNV